MFVLVLLCLFFVVGVSHAEEKLPSVDFSNKTWNIDKGITITNGILTIEGNPEEYRKATITIPAEILGNETFYIVGEIKMRNVKLGNIVYKAPKFKIYLGEKYLARNVAEVDIPEWSTYSLKYKIPQGKKTENLIIEIAMQNCTGIFQVRNLKLSFHPPKSDLSFPFPIPEDLSCTVNVNTKKYKKFNNNLLGFNAHFMAPKIDRSIGYGNDGVQKVICLLS